MWKELAGEPVYVLTADQDWAPAWALQREFEIARAADTPLHLFVTNSDPLVAYPPDGLSLGIHPNFLPGSTHGSDAASVVAHCLELVPRATTARSHAFAEATPWLVELVRQGIRADSNGCTMLQAGLLPVLHACGLLRFPVFLEDDVLLRWAGGVPTLEELAPHLSTPGLKILNFHPSLVGINATSAEDYERARPALFGDGAEPVRRRDGRGVADLLAELLAHVRRDGHTVMALPDLVRRGEELVASKWVGGIFDWHIGAAW